ncbi:MAG: NAD-dependent epimerase/dehydratase family protein, partial [Actinomycetota bacterium]|nr:NAD-dependent epimerase/dehydratase family protein [Actinomycetota bacterium]
MAKTAFVLGGSGLIGDALVPQLVEAGYEVSVGTRSGGQPQDGVRHVRIDRSDDHGFARSLSGDYDLFVDIIAFGEKDARQLLGLAGRIGSLVVISSAAVYADRHGKRLLGSDDDAGKWIQETDPVVPPVADGSDYEGGKVAVEQTLLDAPFPVAVLRPGAIFGPHDRASREWYFVKRVLDGRRLVVLAYMGASMFHTVSSRNLASVIIKAGAKRATGIFNCGDLLPPDVNAIAEAVGDVMDHQFEVTLIDGPSRGAVGDTPWTVPHPFVLDLTAVRRDLDFAPVTLYEDAVSETCEWLVAATSQRPWQDALPKAARYYGT